MSQKEISRLANSSGQFFAILGYYSDSEKMLISAHDKLHEVKFNWEYNCNN